MAKERNINYEPSYEMKMALNAYLDRKGLTDPMSDHKKAVAIPIYNPIIQIPEQSQNNN